MDPPRGLIQGAVQLNDTVYELFKPASTPSMQVLFFYGLQRGDYKYAHLSTWTTGEGSGTMWPQTWFVEEFPGAQVLSVSYDSCTRVIGKQGNMDMYILADNLISDLTMAGVGQIAGCPVILVGHSFGGLVMKELCLQVSVRSDSERGSSKPTNLLNNVKGLFFYSTPHHGFRKEAITRFFSNRPLQDYVKILSSNAERMNIDFEVLRKRFNWRTAAVGEGLPTTYRKLKASMVVPEASSRYGDTFAIIPDADHITVCKPTSKVSRGFNAIKVFVDGTVQKALEVQKASEVVSVHQVSGVPDYAPGLKERLRNIQRLLTEVATVVIVGMGGTGKTTIAKLLFNQISTEFEYTAFVEIAKSIPMHSLEIWLLSCLYHAGKKVDPAEIKWSHLQEKKILIVMDDVDSEEQLLIIVSRLSYFMIGSRLIITSRYRKVSEVCEKHAIYEVPFLREDEAMRLLCHCVFGQESIPKDLIERNRHLEQNVKRVVDKCQGLPLTIEVMGFYLRSHASEARFWEETVDKLANVQAFGGHRNDRMWASLRVSYDALHETEQEMFIDAATYFYEQPLEQALAVWNSAYGNSHVIWKNLLDRFMVKEVYKSTGDISGEKETQYVAVWVHEQLRDLGKALLRDHVRHNSRNVNWLRANARILQLPSGDQEYVTASDSSRQMMLPSQLLDNPESLRYLDLDGVMIEGLLQNFPRRLYLLRWKMRSMTELPQIAFDKMQDLAVLELANWKLPNKFSEALGNLTNLHILDLRHMEGLDHLPANFGNLFRLNQLELVDLGLSMLPDSLGKLGALEYLALVNLTNISALPESFGQLYSLRELVLHGCTQLGSLPESLGQLRALQRLTIEDTGQVEALTNSFGMLSALERLTIRDCEKLQSLPESFGRLNALDVLVLHGCARLERLPDSLGQLRALQRLELVDLGLSMLPDSFGNLGALEYLALVNLTNISSLPDSFGQLYSLRELVLHGCTQLESLPENLGQLRALQTLTIEDAGQVEALPNCLGELFFLRRLTIRDCKKLESLPESIGQLCLLDTLGLHGCARLKRMPDQLGELIALQRLTIEDADELEALPESLGMLSALKRLTIRNCQKLESLPESFGQLSALDVLLLHGCVRLERLPESIGQLRALQRLTIEEADELEALPESLGMLSSLKHLTLVRVGILAFPQSVGELFSLQTLIIQNCEKLLDFPLGFKRLHISERLVVEGCVRLERLPNRIEEASALQNVTLVNASKSAFRDSLRMLSAPKHVTLVNVSIEEFPESFQDLSSLVTLTIRSCLELSSLPRSLRRLSNTLEGLYIHNCPKLSSLPVSIKQLASLKELYIYECPVVRDPEPEAVVQAYFENKSLTADLHIDWNEVNDPSLRTKAKLYRDRNLRLKGLTEKLKAPELEEDKEKERSKDDDQPKVEDTLTVEDHRIKTEVKDCMPLTAAKVYLCGFPEVGKTTLRKSLKRCLQEDCWTKFKWERGPKFLIPQPRTRGIEIGRLEEKSAGGNMTLNLWDLGGQQEYHVLHGNFCFFAGQGPAGGKATTFLLVFRLAFKKGDENDLLYWLRFVALGSSVKRHVVIVLNHFGLTSGSIEAHRKNWQYFIDKFKGQFDKRLDVHPHLFILDVRIASKVKLLKEHLFDYVREELREETMPLLCGKIQMALKLLPQDKIAKFHGILTCQAFEEELKLECKGDQMSSAASYLHEMGDIIYFGEEDSKVPRQEDKILVVPFPEWFCKEVVGEFLHPMKKVMGRLCQKNDNPERFSTSDFEFLCAPHLKPGTHLDSVISMLENLGLCYKIQDNELIVPSLTVGDFDYKSNGWEVNKGVDEGNLVMGRSLAFEDKESTAVPMTLFRKLQVALAKDKYLGGPKSSSYRAGKSFSIFRVDQFVVLVQFDEDDDDLDDDRVDILVKSDIIMDSYASHIELICQAMQILEDVCAQCCPGVTYDIKVIKPWRAISEDHPRVHRMIKRDVTVSLKEIKDLVKEKPDRISTLQSDLHLDLQSKAFLSGSELEELLGFSPVGRQNDIEKQDFDNCKQVALDMGLEGSLEELDLDEQQEPPEDWNSSEIHDVSNYQLLQAIHSDGVTTRMLIDKRHKEVLWEIRNKHQLLAKKIQAQDLFAVQQHSVPRFVFLSRKDGVWIKLREAIGQSTFQLHLLCEANFKTGIVHPVKDQEGTEVSVSKELLQRVEPWVRWSLQVIVTVGKNVGSIYFPGIFSLIPDGSSYPTFVNDRTKLLLNKDEGGKLVADGRGNIGTKEKGTKVGSIAQEVIKGLMESEGPGVFKTEMQLTKVRLNESKEQQSVGPSNQAQGSVLWICFECRDKYGDRVIDVE